LAPCLCFRPDRTFTVAQFTDLHWQNGERDDLATDALMASVLDTEKPDLAVLTGDVIAGSGCADPAESLRRAVAPIALRGLPWALVFGNHDDEGALSRAELMAVAQTCRGCLADPGPAGLTGVGNYRLAVADAGGSGAPAAHLYFLDSGSYAPTAAGGYAWIARDQIAWYAEAAAAARPAGGDPLPALAFFHIPLPEYAEVWDTQTCAGVRYESVCCPRLNSGFLTALHEAGEVLGVFVGHDHVNDYHGLLHGVRLCYGRATGYHTYGREGMARGARLIRLTQGTRDFATWLRLDDGSRVDAQPEHAPEGCAARA